MLKFYLLLWKATQAPNELVIYNALMSCLVMHAASDAMLPLDVYSCFTDPG